MSNYFPFIIIVLLVSTTLSPAQSSGINKFSIKTDKNERRDSTHLAHDNEIVLPESLNEAVESLLTSWQVDFSEANDECVQGQNINYSDSVYIDRLYSLPTEMELSFNSVVGSYIEMYAKRRRDLVSYMLSLGNYYYPMFEEALDRHGLPLELKYLPVIESALNPVAVSRMGATGLWQFMLRTGKQYDLEVNSLVDERRDPYKSTEAAARFLKDLYNIYGDWNLVIAAYNCGPGNVNRAIARSGGINDYWGIYNRLPRETRGYVPAFIAATYIMNYNEEHQICPKEASSEFMFLDTIHVSEQIHFQQISDVLEIPIQDIRRYNPQFKQDIIPGHHKPYALVLPTKSMFAFINERDTIKNHKKETYFAHRKQTLSSAYTHTAANGNVVNTYYRVKSGDTLGAIARRNRTSVKRLQSLNGMKSTKLSIGQRLIVSQTVEPVQVKEEYASGGELKNIYYRIRSGDTLIALARRFETTVAQLKQMNNMNSSRLSIGKNIVVKQERIAPKPKLAAEKTSVVTAEVRRMYPKVNRSPMLKSENILKAYIDKVNRKDSDMPYQIPIL